jgi:hypothetical protein
MMDAADRDRMGHGCLPPPVNTASPAVARETEPRTRSPVAPSTTILPLCTARNVATARLKTSEWRTVTWLAPGMVTTRLSAIALLEYYQFFR